jgi:hypothetical protein
MKIKGPKLIRVDAVTPGKVFSYQGEQFYKLDGQDLKYNVVRFKMARLDHLDGALEVTVHPNAELTL